jgi:transcriptional regulator with XRE-family HTH domain
MLKLKEIREKRGLTQQELANMLGVHKITISKYENEKLKIDQDTIIKLSILLETNPNDLLGYTEGYTNFKNYLMSLKKPDSKV